MPEIPDFADLGNEDVSATKEQLPKFEFPEFTEKTPESGKEDFMPDFENLKEIEREQLPPSEPVSAETSPPDISAPLQGGMPASEELGNFPEEFTGFEKHTLPQRRKHLQSEVHRGNLVPGIIKREKESDFEQIIKSGTSMYVRVDKFKAAIGSINVIRSDLKKSEDALMKLENIKVAKDRNFEKVRSSLDDLQKKIIFIDKTLFKGE